MSPPAVVGEERVEAAVEKLQEPARNAGDDGDVENAAETAADKAHAGDGEGNAAPPATGAGSRKRKKKKPPTFSIPAQDNSRLRRVGDWPALDASPIDYPPTVPIHQGYRGKKFPVGECVHYVGANDFRATSAEKREAERLHEDDYQDIRRAAECHRQVRKYVQSFVEPGMKMIDICQKLEAKSKELIGAQGLTAGFGFPTGCSLNHVAAHYTPNYGDETVLQANDICKLDFGVHVRGRIIDCAFTIAFDPMFDPIIQCTQDATNAGIKAAGIDVRFYEVSKEIEEVLNSYEMEVDGRLVPIKPIANLNGHSIDRYRIHGGKSLPIVNTGSHIRMEENEIYAIETFATTGKGRVIENGETSHYMCQNPDYLANIRTPGARKLLGTIQEHFGTLAFCRRWLDDVGEKRHLLSLKQLVDNGLVEPYPPLCDIKGSFTSQMEHTIVLRPTCKEVVSRGQDY